MSAFHCISVTIYHILFYVNESVFLVNQNTAISSRLLLLCDPCFGFRVYVFPKNQRQESFLFEALSVFISCHLFFGGQNGKKSKQLAFLVLSRCWLVIRCVLGLAGGPYHATTNSGDAGWPHFHLSGILRRNFLMVITDVWSRERLITS